MSKNATLAAELEILTAALEEPGADVAQSLHSLIRSMPPTPSRPTLV